MADIEKLFIESNYIPSEYLFEELNNKLQYNEKYNIEIVNSEILNRLYLIKSIEDKQIYLYYSLFNSENSKTTKQTFNISNMEKYNDDIIIYVLSILSKELEDIYTENEIFNVLFKFITCKLYELTNNLLYLYY